jgi:hypothetical protein
MNTATNPKTNMVMKPFDYYGIADIPYPVKSEYVTIYVYSKGEILWQGGGENLAEVRKQYPDALIESHFDGEAYRERVGAHRGAVAKKENEFIQDLFEEFGVTDNPKKRTLLFDCLC